VHHRIQDEIVAAGTTARYTGVLQTITKVANEEGILKLWRGVTPVLIGSMPECALEIGGNSLAREKLAERLKKPLGELPSWGEYACGGVGGFFQVIATCPMERLKILQQVMGDKAGSVSQMVSQIGVPGLYQGVGACFARDIAFAALYFGIYHDTRKYMLQRKRAESANKGQKGGKESKLSPLDDLMAGLVAGVPAAWLTCPLDVIKTRMQACGIGADGCRVAVGSFSSTAAELWAEGGVAAFYKVPSPPCLVSLSSPPWPRCGRHVMAQGGLT
jgi:solute carrier family 25 aspartate/glutamate transporter 12/13